MKVDKRDDALHVNNLKATEPDKSVSVSILPLSPRLLLQKKKFLKGGGKNGKTQFDLSLA